MVYRVYNVYKVYKVQKFRTGYNYFRMNQI